MTYETITIGIAIISFLISIGTMIFYVGKWSGMQNYIHKEIGELKTDFKSFQNSIDALKKEGKDDRHEFSRFIQERQADFWKELSDRLEKFESRWQIKLDKLEDKLNDKLKQKEDK